MSESDLDEWRGRRVVVQKFFEVIERAGNLVVRRGTKLRCRAWILRGRSSSARPKLPRLKPSSSNTVHQSFVDFPDQADGYRQRGTPFSAASAERQHQGIPVILGGDHSITEPNIRAIAAVHGPVGLVHFDTHTDTGEEVFGVEVSHGTPMYRLVRDGHVDARRYVQLGLRGYWPGEKEFAWQAEQGITSLFMHDIRDHGIKSIVEQAIAIVGDGPTFLTVDVDVLDPAFAPGTGTPEPGGMTPIDLLWACRTLAARLRLVGMDVVEVIPTTVGSADVTALVAERVVRETLTGLALRRRG